MNGRGALRRLPRTRFTEPRTQRRARDAARSGAKRDHPTSRHASLGGPAFRSGPRREPFAACAALYGCRREEGETARAGGLTGVA